MSGFRSSPNRLLACLPSSDFALLEPHLQRVDLPLRKTLESRGRRIDEVYFIETGIASVVADGRGSGGIEVGLIGREGMTGIAAILGAERAAHATFMQVAGSGLSVGAQVLRDAFAISTPLHHLFLRFAHTFFIQATYTALANGRSKVEERLARWLLMAQDRVGANDLPLTHEFLSVMLGVHRPGVTNALKALATRGLIQPRRSLIRVLDRNGLKKVSNGTYGAAEAEFEKLFGGRRGRCGSIDSA